MNSMSSCNRGRFLVLSSVCTIDERLSSDFLTRCQNIYALVNESVHNWHSWMLPFDCKTSKNWNGLNAGNVDGCCDPERNTSEYLHWSMRKNNWMLRLAEHHCRSSGMPYSEDHIVHHCRIHDILPPFPHLLFPNRSYLTQKLFHRWYFRWTID